MAVLKARNPNNPDQWIDIAGPGPAGGPGPEGPTGPLGPTGAAGGAVVAEWAYGGEQINMGAVNTLTSLVSLTVHLKPEQTIEVTAGVRCFQDLGAPGIVQIQCSVAGVALPTHSVISHGDGDGLWGSWSRSWIRGADWAIDMEGDYVIELKAMCSVASKIAYSPEVSCIILSDPSLPILGAGPTGPLGNTGPTGPVAPLTPIYTKELIGPFDGGASATATFTDMPDGDYTLTVSASAVAEGTGMRNINVMVDGAVALDVSHYFNAPSVHHSMSPQMAPITLTAGDHTVVLTQQASITSDLYDRALVTLTPVQVAVAGPEGPPGPAGPPGPSSGITTLDGLDDVATAGAIEGSALVMGPTGLWAPGAPASTEEYLPLTGGEIQGPLGVTGPVDITGDYLSLHGDGFGIRFHGDGRMYKRAGGGLVIREHADVPLQVESTDAASRWNVLDTGNILGSNIAVSWLNGWSGTCSYRVSPSMVTCSMVSPGRNAVTAAGTTVKMMDYPSGVPAPFAQISCIAQIGDATAQAAGLGIASVEFRTDGVFLRTWNTECNATNHRIWGVSASWTR